MNADQRIAHYRNIIEELAETILWMERSNFTINPGTRLAEKSSTAELVSMTKNTIAMYEGLIASLGGKI
jgi:hypothetical protein